MNVQEAGDAARIQHLGSQTPTGRAMLPEGGTVGVESGIPEAAIEALKKKGHKFVSAPGTFGGYQAIFIDHKQGTLHGGSDPRKDGCAVGY
jgi:gamma-glutamyltranspeptidase/glutathione hydrolase